MDGSKHQAAVFAARPLITSRTGRTEVSIVATWMGWGWAIRGLESGTKPSSLFSLCTQNIHPDSLFNLTHGLFLYSQDFHIPHKGLKQLAELPKQPRVGTSAGYDKFVSNNPGSAPNRPSSANDGSASMNPPGSTDAYLREDLKLLVAGGRNWPSITHFF
ncbi:hypothetical protein N7497_004906 [Penicillium chrysogenum]|nr:hypothetical protein N7497_004906 [Penicillium chrysogenum]